MLSTLIKIRFQGLLGSMVSRLGSGKNGKVKMASKGKIVLLALLYLYLLVIFGFLFFSTFSQLVVFSAMGFGWVYFAFYAVFSFALMIMGSAAVAKTQIFDAKDNDLLLSMPIKPSDIIVSRVMMLVLINLIYFMVVLIPAGLAWTLGVGFSVIGILAFILLSAALLLLSTAFGVFLGWVIALVSRKSRNKTAISVLFNLLFLGAYFYVYASAQQYITYVIANGNEIAGKLKAILPLYWFGSAISDGNILGLILALLICLIPFAVVFVILEKTFNKIIADSSATVRIKERKAKFDAVSPKKALMRHELNRLMSSSPYLINSGMGVIMAIIAAVACIVKGKDLMTQIMASGSGDISGIAALVLLIVAAFLIGMVYFTSASISIEGKNLWILRSLPVSTRDILDTKLKLHIRAVLIPAVLLWIAINYCIYIDAVFVVYSFVMIALYVVLTANIGLIENIKHPVLDWQDEVIAVKNGASVMFTVFINMFLTTLPIALCFISAIPLWARLAIWLAVIAVLTAVTTIWIHTRGVKRFENL